MAQVQLDEVSDLDVQIANEHVLLGLGVDRTVREGEIYQDHPYSPASLVLPSLARMLYSLSLNCKFKLLMLTWLMQVVVLSKKWTSSK